MEQVNLLRKSRRSSLNNNNDFNYDSTESDDENYLVNELNDNFRFYICQSTLFKKFALCGFMLLFCVLLYIPLSNNVQTRIGEIENLPNNCKISLINQIIKLFYNNNDNKTSMCNSSGLIMHDDTWIVPIAGWNYNTSRDTTEYVLPNFNTTLIDPVHICNGNKFFLLVVVCSSPTNFEARQAIRETWGNITEFNYPLFSKMHSKLKGKYLEINNLNWKNYVINSNINIDNNNNNNSTFKNSTNSSHDKIFSVKIVFLIGQVLSNETQIKIIEENDINSDIIQENFIDSYNNLTIKSVMMLKWVINNCADKVKFVMKCDDDIFLNVPNLLHVLFGGTVPLYNVSVGHYDSKTVRVLSNQNRLTNIKKLLIGFLFCRAKPIADITSKWYSPIYMYSGEIYPNYVSGTGYVMTMDTAKLLYNASFITPLFHLEDVYLTGICASLIKLRPHHHPLFFHDRIENKCALKAMITQHQVTPDKIRKAYEFLMNPDSNCPPPSKFYNMKKIRPRQKFCQ